MTRTPTQTKAFVDSASLHDAFTALILGKRSLWSPWHEQALIDCTYLLLFNNVKIAPGPGREGVQAVPGPEEELASELPALLNFPSSREAERKVRRWLSRPNRPLKQAWQTLQSESQLEHWNEVRRRLWWPVYARVNTGLFNLEDVRAIAGTLDVSPGDIRKIHALSTDPKVVKTWTKKNSDDDEVRLTDSAYLISSLIRGKYHEYLARDVGLQLVAHPHRSVIAGQTRYVEPVYSTNTARRMVEILIGSALIERQASRVTAWRTNLLKARDALGRGSLLLPELAEPESWTVAIDVARRIGIESSPQWQRRLLSFALGEDIALLSSLVVAHWGAAVAVALRGYRLLRGRSLPDDLTNILKTDGSFRHLASRAPGRIQRKVLTGEGSNKTQERRT